jgi:hypothetical protein
MVDYSFCRDWQKRLLHGRLTIRHAINPRCGCLSKSFFAPFRDRSSPSEMKLFRDIFSNQYPAVEALQPQELYDASLVDQFDFYRVRSRGLVGEHE